MKPRSKLKLFLILLSVFFFCSCATIYNPATQKNEFIFIGTPQEVALGKLLVAQLKLQVAVSKDQELVNRLNNIGERVAQHSQRKDLKYNFYVANDKELNAFALPGGFIFVNSGLIKAASDDELASVVAHEIGHVAAKHSVKKLQASLGYSILMSLALGSAKYADVSRAMDTVFNYVSLGYSREDERLADKLAVIYSYEAGYDPQGMVTFFEKLKEESDKNGSSRPLVFLSSHPSIEERIENAKKQIALLKDPAFVSTTLNKAEVPVASLSGGKENCLNGKICPVCSREYSNKDNFCLKDGARLICK